MKLRTIPTLAASLLAISALTATAQVEIPTLINYQGFVTDDSAVPLGNGTATNYDVQFKIYNSSTGSAASNILWGEAQTVTIIDGQFSVLLGNGIAINQTTPHGDLGDLFAPGVLAAEQVFIGLTVNTAGQTGEPELTPRQQLVSNPFSLRSLRADHADTTAFAQTVANNAITSSQIANGAVTSAKIANGSVSTNQITNNAVTSTQIANGAVGSSEIADGSISAADVPWVKSYTPSGSGSGLTLEPAGPFRGRLTLFSDAFFGTTSGGELTFIEIGALGSSLSSRLGSSGSNFFIKRHKTDTARAELNASGSWSSSSDVRLKKDVTPAVGLLDRALELEPVHYRFKSDAPDKTPDLGFTAQDVAEQFPEFVTKGDSWSLNYAGLSTVAIGAIKEQNAAVTDQARQIETLQNENAALKARLERLEKAILAK